MDRRVANEYLVRILAALAYATGAAWIVWHIAKGRAGAQPVLTVVLIVLEVLALFRLVAFVVRSTAVPEVAVDAFDDDASGTVIVRAEAHDVRTLRAAVLAARLAWNSDGVILVDPTGRDDVRRLCAQMRVPLSARVDDALAATESSLVALVDGNHAVLPDVFCRAAPFLADTTFGFVQAPVPTGDPMSRFVDEVGAPSDAHAAAALFRGTAVVFEPTGLLDAGGILDARHGGALATTVALAGAGITGYVSTDAFVTPVRPPDRATWGSDQSRRTASELRILWRRTNPMWARGLRPGQRLVFTDELLGRLTGFGALAAVTLAVATLFTGKLPVVATPAAVGLAAAWAVLTMAVHIVRARGRLAPLAIAASAAAAMGPHLRGVGQLLRGRNVAAEVSPREPSGERSAPRRVVLGLAVTALAAGLVARATAMRFQRGVSTLAPLATTASAVGALVLLAALLAGADLFTLGRADREAPVALSSDELGLQLVALDADRIELEAAAPPGTEVRTAIRLPTSTGSRPVTVTARVAWRRRIGDQRWRVAGPYNVTPPAAADELLAHTVVTFPYQRARDGRSRLPDVQVAAFPSEGPPGLPAPAERGPLRFMAIVALVAVVIVSLWPHPTAVASVLPREITGLVFDDQNADGAREAGLTLTEPGVGRVSVRALDDSGNAVSSTVSDADGRYHLPLTGHVTRVFVVFDVPDGYGEGPHGPDSTGAITVASVGDEHVDVGLIRPADFCTAEPPPTSDTTEPSSSVPTIVPTLPTVATTSTSSVAAPTPTTVTGGEGEPVICQRAPTEIGDHVWSDVNGDGVRQPTEPALGGVRLELWADGHRVGTAVTDSAGGYAFSSLPSEAATGNDDSVGGGLTAETAVEIRVPSSTGANQQLTLQGLSPTVRGAGTGPLAPSLDSDGVLRGTDAVATVTSGPLGKIDHDIDFGFTSGLTVGNRVFNDVNANGRIDQGEPGIGGAIVSLFADPDGDGQHDTSSVARTTSAADGQWLLKGVPPGRYVIDVSGVPVGYVSSTGTGGSGTGPYEGPLTPRPGSAIDGDDNGTTVSPPGTPLVVRTKSFTLAAGGEPILEGDRSPDDPGRDSWSDTTIDFGFFLPATVSGRVWQDTNRNGLLDEPSTAGTDGAFVRLYTNDGALIATTTTNHDPKNPDSLPGSYSFTNLAPGDYRMAVAGLPVGAVVVPPGQGDDRSLDSDVDPITGITTAAHQIDPGQTDTTFAAGWYGPSLSLGDTVWRDANANGLLDPGETGFDGVTVKLFTPEGTAAAPDQTTSDGGRYLFTGLAAGDYVVEVTPPAGGWRSSGPGATNQDVNDRKDGDNNGTPAAATAGLPIRTAVVHLVPATNTAGLTTPGHAVPEGAKPEDADVSVDFGLYQPTGLAVDLAVASTTPGPYAAGQEVVLRIEATNKGPGPAAAGWKITDTFPSGLLPSTIESGPSGCALSGRVLTCVSKSPLPASAPPVDVVVHATVVADASAGGSSEVVDAAAIEPAPGDVPALHPPLDPADQSVDRVVLELATTGVGGTAWYDQRHDGTRQSGEPALSGVRAKLLDASRNEVTVGPDGVLGTSDDALGGVLTSSTGRYHFTALTPGTYSVQFALPDGYELTGSGPATTVDPVTMRSAPVTIAAGVDSPRVDIGAHKPSGSIGDLVWSDRNRDGHRDDAEPGIPGLPVSLLNADLSPVLGPTGNPLGVVTDGLGGYRFADVEPGQYVVSFPLPQGLQRSPKAAAADDGALDSDADPRTGLSGVVIVDPGANVSTVDSGLSDIPTLLGGIVWTDKDYSGRLDPGESAIAEVKLELVDAAGQRVATTTTGPDGRYRFVGMAPGRYALRLDPASLPLGVAFTTRDVALTSDVGSDVDDRTGTSALIDVGRHFSATTWDIGLTFVGSVADGVWFDNGNGMKDQGEPLASGVGVALTDSTGTTVDATVTDDAGNYRFDRVRPGSYAIAFSNFPAGYQLTAAKATSDAAVDSDPDPSLGRTDPFEVHGSDEGGFHGAGLVRPRATITGLAWVDANGNGTFDDQEEANVGLQVALISSDGRLAAAGLVSGSGDYSFTDVAPGRYQIAYTLPAGLRLTDADAKASKVDAATMRTEPFDIQDGATDDSWTLRAERKPSPADEAVAALQSAQHRYRRANRAGRVVLAGSSAALACLVVVRGWRQRRKRLGVQ